uniref:Uncharacterized protein n=1 Tax=Anguilla anguilla TaxID=7936 RepID=A0A0E9X313_ANGAN
MSLFPRKRVFIWPLNPINSLLRITKDNKFQGRGLILNTSLPFSFLAIYVHLYLWQ